MPIYPQTYRSFEGHFRRRFRWAVVVKQELKVLVKARVFLLLILAALMHFILRLLQVVAYDVVMQNPNNPLTPLLQQVTILVVNEKTFFDFIRIQSPVVFLICLYAGSGMIANDFNNNLMKIYFSKPLSWRDYALGKILTLVAIGLTLTAVPGVILVILHNFFVPSMDTLRESYWWPAAIVGYSLVIVTPCALSVLASSALLRSQRYASVTVFMLLAANSAMGGLLATLLHDRNYLIVSFPLALNRVGQAFFGDRRLLFDLRWEWSMLFVLVVSLGALRIICRQVRRAEVAA